MNKGFNNNSHRLLRVNELIKREISLLLQGMEWEEQGIKNLNLTLTDVECSKDIRIAKIYSDHLRDKDLILPKLRKDSLHVFHLYVIRSRERDKLLNFLKEKEIFAGIHYPFPIHKQPAYKKRFKTSESMLVTEIASKEVLSLPIYPELNDNDIDYILEMFTLFLSKK